jgi:hypothetical protein
MEIPIQPDDVLTLAVFHFMGAALLFAIGWQLLPRSKRIALGIGLGLVWIWSLAAMLDFMWENTGFNSWFLNPSAEKNLSAMFSSAMLLLIGLIALYLLWRSANHQVGWQRVYWLIVGLLFTFLAVDEYFSIHESISFWRQGYLALGGSVALFGLVIIAKSEKAQRLPLLMFIVGLGSMGGFGVLVDAFSAGNVVTIGSFTPDFMTCRTEFLGVICRDFNNTEETAEMFGMIIMVLSLLVVAQLWTAETKWKLSRNIVLAMSGIWLAVMAGGLWIAPAIEAQFAQSASANYGDLSLVAYSVSGDRIEAGHMLDVTVFMQVNRSIDSDYWLSLHLYTQALPEIDSIAQDDMVLGEFKYPTRAWIPYLPVRNQFQLQIPDDLVTPASYQLVAIIWQDTLSNKIAVQETNLATIADGTVIVLEGIAALAPEVAAVPMSAAYDFASNFALEGYDLPAQAVSGEDVTVDFWWSTEQVLDLELSHFLHWFNTETGEYVIFDQIPFGGAFPTQDWPASMLVHDAWTVTLPDDMPTGTYRIQTGMFYINSGERVPVVDVDGVRVQDDSIVLGTVVVEK